MLHALVALPCLAQGVTLRFQPPVGASVAYSTKTETTQNVPGMAEPIVSTTEGTMTLRVVSREGGVTTLETKTGATKVAISPQSMAAGMKDRMEKLASNQTTTTLVDELGAIKQTKLGVTGPDAALARQIGSGVLEGAQGVTFPTQPLNVGDSWNATMDMGKALEKSMGPQAKATGKIPIVFRLVGVNKDGDLTLAKVSMAMKGEATATAGGATTVKMTMNMTGEFVMDVATGFLRSSSAVGDNDIAVAGQTMRQHIVTTTKAL